MSKRNVIRKNRKIKFSEIDYVEKNYMVNGKAVIPVELDDVNDLYMKHDYKHMELSDEVCDYIEEIAYMIPINTDIIIEVHCPLCDTRTQEKMKKSIKNNFGIEIDDVDYDMMMANRRSLILAIVGIIILIINFLVDKYVWSLFSDFLSVAWWVAIWDMIELQTIDKNENKAKRLNYQQLYDANITFVFDK